MESHPRRDRGEVVRFLASPERCKQLADDLRWTPLSSARLGLVSFRWVMAAVLEPGGRRDRNDNWSL
jgi:hypothetical protein